MSGACGAERSLCRGGLNCQRGARAASFAQIVSRETAIVARNPLKGMELAQLRFEKKGARKVIYT